MDLKVTAEELDGLRDKYARLRASWKARVAEDIAAGRRSPYLERYAASPEACRRCVDAVGDCLVTLGERERCLARVYAAAAAAEEFWDKD